MMANVKLYMIHLRLSTEEAKQDQQVTNRPREPNLWDSLGPISFFIIINSRQSSG